MEYNSEFNIAKEKQKNRDGKFLTSFLLPLFFGIVGAFIAIYLLFNVFNKQKEVVKFFGLDFIEKQNTFSFDNNNKEEKTENVKLVVDLEEFNKTSIGVAKKVLPSIVNIDTEYDVETIFSEKAKTVGTGSGIIISEDGYILTNNHVVSPQKRSGFFTVGDATKIIVTLSNDKEYEAKIVGVDKITDLAVIKIEENNLEKAIIGDSDNIVIGEFVMAIGSPLGFQGSVTDGIISSVNRKIKLSDGTSLTAIQTNASINNGNSGGALVNSKGEVIGINTLKLAGGGIEGLGFAIPINSTKSVVEQLINNKKVERPSLGFSGKVIDEKLADEFSLPTGLIVKEVFKGSTAENVGLKEKDIVTKVNGKEITNFTDIENLKTDLKYDEEITITVFREGKEIDLKGKVIKFENEKQLEEEQKNKNNENNNIPNIKRFQDNNDEIFKFFFED